MLSTRCCTSNDRLLPVSKGIFFKVSSRTRHKGLLSAILIPISKDTLKLRVEMSPMQSSAVSKASMICTGIGTEPPKFGKTALYPNCSAAGLNRD